MTFLRQIKNNKKIRGRSNLLNNIKETSYLTLIPLLELLLFLCQQHKIPVILLVLGSKTDSRGFLNLDS